MIVVDVGANIGVYSRFLAELVGVNGKVGSRTGDIVLFESDELNVDHRAYPTTENRREVRVPCWALDDYILSDRPVDLVKIDVQGFELSVLRGAARVLKTNADIVVLLEFWPHSLRAAGDTPMALVDYLSKECGLQLYEVKGRRLTFFDANFMDEGPGSYCNVLAVRARDFPSLSDMLP